MRLGWKGVIRQYKDYLPVSSKTPIVSLDEGNTPLIFAEFLSKKLDHSLRVYLKYEGLNPTGSFKDRGMTVAISKAIEGGAKAVICASTGNTSASASSYAAKANLKCFIIIPEGAIAQGKLAQALIHGAKVIAIKGNFDDALRIVKRLSADLNITLVNSLNPYRLEGQKTAAFEICDILQRAPDYNLIPVGNAGNITAYWMGYKEYYEKGKIKSLPRMVGFQAEHAAPIVKGKPIKNPRTIASAIRIGNPASWQKALLARDESRGLITTVSDRQILDAYSLLANKEGLFVEPASAASVAGLIKLSKANYFKRGSNIVCVLTGHGLKDPDRAIHMMPRLKALKPDFEKVKELIL
ncbi:MAG: threonine synthase [Candidatus Omnitrophica bacterium]|nr:threonine synthase [Candidatus Omnitrophota bacterium]